jgi:magnesium and cobalt transporter
MIVGDIEDEHGQDESPKMKLPREGFLWMRADLGKLWRVDADLRAIGDAGEVDTLGGLIRPRGAVPVRGEIIVEDGIEFEVADADPRRVKRVKICMSEARLRSKHDETIPFHEPA